MTLFIIIGLLLALKHFVCDGPLQGAYQYLNKGKFLHPGGLLHASLHGLCTFMIFWGLGYPEFGVFDFLAHYFIDLLKTKLTAGYGWSLYVKPSPPAGVLRPHLRIYSDLYFYALVFDQSCHFATYVLFLSVMAK